MVKKEERKKFVLDEVFINIFIMLLLQGSIKDLDLGNCHL